MDAADESTIANNCSDIGGRVLFLTADGPIRFEGGKTFNAMVARQDVEAYATMMDTLIGLCDGDDALL
jgi:hypothetical protein